MRVATATHTNREAERWTTIRPLCYVFSQTERPRAFRAIESSDRTFMKAKLMFWKTSRGRAAPYIKPCWGLFEWRVTCFKDVFLFLVLKTCGLIVQSLLVYRNCKKQKIAWHYVILHARHSRSWTVHVELHNSLLRINPSTQFCSMLMNQLTKIKQRRFSLWFPQMTNVQKLEMEINMHGVENTQLPGSQQRFEGVMCSSQEIVPHTTCEKKQWHPSLFFRVVRDWSRSQLAQLNRAARYNSSQGWHTERNNHSCLH